MNRDDIIRMMNEALSGWNEQDWLLERFAALVAAAAKAEEREACLSILRDMEGRKWHLAMHGGEMKGVSLHDAYKAICARGLK